MKQEQKQADGHTPESYESITQQLTIESGPILAQEDQTQLDRLVEQGFAWEEAILLLGMREHLYENIETRQRMAEDSRIQFARWLHEHGELNEGCEAIRDEDKKSRQ